MSHATDGVMHNTEAKVKEKKGVKVNGEVKVTGRRERRT